MNGRVQSMLIVVLIAHAGSAVQAGERTAPADPYVATGARSSGQGATKGARPGAGTVLDRVAYAVDGAESSHGADPTIWRPDNPAGPQGPMQVSEGAAADVGGGDRFDWTENRALGRAYLAQLYRRYRNWPDAIAAYNWGMGNVDNWISAGRPPDKFVAGVGAYLRRVLHDSGICDSWTATPVGAPKERTLQANRQSREAREEASQAESSSFAAAACADLEAWGGLLDDKNRPLLSSQSRFYSKLENAMALVMQHLPASQRSADGRATVSLKAAAQQR
jgi:Transglycosylase SLT domain